MTEPIPEEPVISPEERAALLAKEKADAKKSLLIAYAPWDNVITAIRKFLLFETYLSFIVSIFLIVTVHCTLWYGSILALQYGFLTITSVIGIFITLIIWIAQKLGFNLIAQAKEKAKEAEKVDEKTKEKINEEKAEEIQNKTENGFDLRDIIDIYVETTYAANDIKTKLLDRLTSGEALGFGLVLRIIVLLAIIAVVGLVIDGFWIVYVCTFVMLLSPTLITSVLNKGYHKPLMKVLQPISSRSVGFLKSELIEKTQSAPVIPTPATTTPSETVDEPAPASAE
jgi:uncharacterized membrane protein